MPWQCFLTDGYSDPRSMTPGAIWKVKIHDGSIRNRDHTYILRLPGGGLWDVFSTSTNGSGWQITGDAPNFTASPSVNCYDLKKEDGSLLRAGWHGWLKNGVLSDDLEGRTY